MDNGCATPTARERMDRKRATALSDEELEALWECLNRRIATWERELGWGSPVAESKTNVIGKGR
jgi:hypothetical protein